MAMKKKEIVNKIKHHDEEAPKYIQTYLTSNAILKLIMTYTLLIFAFLMVDRVNKLSFISPDLFFIVTISFAAFMVILLIALCYNKYYKDNSMKASTLYHLFDVYDMLSFILMSIIVMFFILLFILTPTTVSGVSMESSYYNNDRLLVWHLGYTPTTDDVVIIDVNKYISSQEVLDEKFFIKRIVATKGDTVEFHQNTGSTTGNLYVNGEEVLHSTTKRPFDKQKFEVLTSYKSTTVLDSNNVVEGDFSIVLGDNRNNSYDSRYIGAIKNSDIQGKVVFRFYSKEGKFGFPKKNIIYEE